MFWEVRNDLSQILNRPEKPILEIWISLLQWLKNGDVTAVGLGVGVPFESLPSLPMGVVIPFAAPVEVIELASTLTVAPRSLVSPMRVVDIPPLSCLTLRKRHVRQTTVC